MRKLLVFVSVIFVMFSLLLAGCSKGSDKELVSRPVVAKDISDGSSPADADIEMGTDIVEPAPVVTAPSANVYGSAKCNQLSASDLSGLMGGAWQETDDCPSYHMMPKGVSVCQCSFDGPKYLYVNLETQLYDDSADALRVFRMYCDTDEAEVGDKSCREKATISSRPNFVYFLKGNYFVKVSCLGGTCPLDAVAAVAKIVDAKI